MNIITPKLYKSADGMVEDPKGSWIDITSFIFVTSQYQAEIAALNERILTLEAVNKIDKLLIEEYRADIKRLRQQLDDCKRRAITKERL